MLWHIVYVKNWVNYNTQGHGFWGKGRWQLAYEKTQTHSTPQHGDDFIMIYYDKIVAKGKIVPGFTQVGDVRRPNHTTNTLGILNINKMLPHESAPVLHLN